jgi:type VI secretion system secreted protein VgrG
MTRRATIQTPLGPLLQLRKLTGEEAMNDLFTLDAELLSTSSGINPKALLGQHATVALETAGGGLRYLDGVVTRFAMAGQDHRHYAYRIQLRPWLWLATRKRDFRIFQFKTVPEILQQVLGAYGEPLEQRLTRSYRMSAPK